MLPLVSNRLNTFLKGYFSYITIELLKIFFDEESAE